MPLGEQMDKALCGGPWTIWHEIKELSCSRTQLNLLEPECSRAWSKALLLTTLDRETQICLLFLIPCRKHHCNVTLLEGSVPFLLRPGLVPFNNKLFASPLGMQTRSCQVRRATEAGSGPQHPSSDPKEISDPGRLFY